MTSTTWRHRAWAWLEATLPERIFWIMLNAAQIRRGYLHEQDFRVFRQLGNQAFLLADIGAHHGESAISIFSTAPAARVISFEPNVRARMAMAVIKLRFGRRFSWRHTAVANQSGTTQLHIPASGSFRHTPSASLEPSEFDKDYVRERFRADAEGMPYTDYRSTTVPVVRLDDTGIDPDIIKIDVEGSEAAVLRGARKLIEKHAPMLMIELNNRDALLPLLEAFGYSLFRRDPDTDRLVEFHGDESPLNIFALSERTRADFRRRLLPGHRFPSRRPD